MVGKQLLASLPKRRVARDWQSFGSKGLDYFDPT